MAKMNPCFTVDCKEALEALKERKFHRPNKSTVMFPNLDLVEKDLDIRLSNITHGIGVALRENDPLAIDYYCNSIIGYINRLSFRLPRQTLIDLIPLLIQAATLPNQKGDLVHTIFEALSVLLVKSRLTRADLTIPLKALFDLFQGIIYGKNAEVLYQNVFGTLVRMKRFYALEDVKELWNTRLLSLLSPLEHGFHWVDLCITFLPTDMMREEHELFGSGLWFSTLWNLYSKYQMNVEWSKYLPELFYKLERDQPGLIDWRPYEEEIFTRILRALQMKGESSTYGLTTSLKHWAAWVAYRLGRNSCLSQLQRVLRYAEPLLHPSNDGPHTEVILLFLNELTHKVLARYRRERIKKHTKDLRPSEFHLDDLELHRFVVSILPVTLSAVFLEIDSEQNLPSDILKKLATFVPSLVLPKILELVYPSLKATCEPHRFNQSLRCLEEVILLLCQEKSEAHLSIVSNGFGNGEEDGVGSLTFTGESKETISVRSHVILILDELVDGIDINDLDKIIIVVQIMSHFFYLIPNVDASSLAENGDSLTDEERALCRLTARLPVIAEKAIEKIITIITIMAAVPERNEEGCNGTESEEFGSDEKTLKKAIEKCVNALFVNAVKAVRLKMAHQILSFVHTNVIGAPLAADLAQTLVQSTVFYVPEVADELVSFICQKVTSGLNDFTQSGKAKCDAALRWWANLFPCLVVTPWVSEENREKILLVVDNLLTQTDPALYQPATYTLSGFLVFSSQIQESGWMAVHAEIDKPLTEWIPVRHWGTLHSPKQMKVHWRTPGEAEIDFAQQIINKYFKEVVERLTSDESAKNEAIRRDLFLMRVLYFTSKPLLPPLNEIEERMDEETDESVKIPRFTLRPKIANKELTLNGADLCTTFVKTLEMILARTSENDEEQTRLLLHIAQCATFAINSSVVFAGILFEQMETVNDLVNRVRCLVQREKRMALALAHASLELDYIVYQYFLPNGPFTSVHLRVLRMLVQCSLSVYQEVSQTARGELEAVCDCYLDSKQHVVETVVEVLELSEQYDDQVVEAALSLIRDLKLAALPRGRFRNRVWAALLSFKVVDRPNILQALDDIWTTIFNMPQLPQNSELSKDEETVKAQNKLAIEAQEFLNQLPDVDFWMEYKSSRVDGKSQEKIRNEEIKAIDECTLRLLNFCDSTDFHRKQRELARVMMWASNRSLPTPDVLKTFLTYTTDEEYTMRRFAWYCIKYWLKKSKPKTKKIRDWIGPERDSMNSPFACGLREDNLFAAYAVQKLPKREDDWEKAIFIKNQYGGYKWPSYPIEVRQGGCGIEESKNPELDAVFCEFFSNSENLDALVEIWTLNTNDRANNEPLERKVEHNDVACALKYLIRNYERVDQLQDLFGECLKKLLLSKKNEEQRVASEFFFGIVKGSRHHSFSRLHKQWSWLSPVLKNFLDNINGECEGDWWRTMSLILKGEDVRQFWWLVEALIEAMNSSMSLENSWHYAFKTSLLSSSTWRETELWNRLVEKALKNLPNARMPSQREGVLNILTNAVSCKTDNFCNDFLRVPQSFQLTQLDQWIEILYNKLAEFVRSAERSFDTPEPHFQPSTPISLSLANWELISPKVGLLSMKHPLAALDEVLPITKNGFQSPINKDLLPAQKNLNSLPDVAARVFTLRLSQNRLFQSRTKTTPSPGSPMFVLSAAKCSSLISITQAQRSDESVIYLRTLIDLLTMYCRDGVFGMSKTMLSILPMILQISHQEADENSAEFGLGGELKQAACTLVFDLMAPAPIDEKCTDYLLQKLHETLNSAVLWKVKQGVLRFIQITALSNMIVFLKNDRPKRVLELMMKGITDLQAEVRAEAAKCLMNLVYLGYFEVDQRFIEICTKICSSSSPSVSEGGLLAVCALVQAFPFSCPTFLPELIKILCSLSNAKSGHVKKFTTQALREFRRTHRDSWSETKRVLGMDLLYEVENVCAPSYYV